MKTTQASLVSVDMVCEAMKGFVVYLAKRWEDEEKVMDFSVDDLIGELQLELVKSAQHYISKGLSDGQMKAVLRRCLDNRIAELRHRYFGTHRFKATLNISIEMVFDSSAEDDDHELNLPDPDAMMPEPLYMSYERVELTRNRLTDNARKVFDACIFGDSRLTMMVFLATKRLCSRKPNSSAKLKPWVIAETLDMKERDVRSAFKEISSVYSEVCGDN